MGRPQERGIAPEADVTVLKLADGQPTGDGLVSSTKGVSWDPR